MNDMSAFPAVTPLAMAYVPVQSWETPYEELTGFANGTIFPSLYYPFMNMKPMINGMNGMNGMHMNEMQEGGAHYARKG